MKQTHSCGAVVWRDNAGVREILLIKQFKDKDSWGIPKGRMNEGETFEQTAVREVKEETGITIQLGQRLIDAETIWRNDQKIVVSYLAQQIGDDKLNTDDPDCEVADAQWFAFDALPRIHQYQQNLVSYAIGLLKAL